MQLRMARYSRLPAGHTTINWDLDMDSRFREQNRLSHKKLTMTNYRNIYLRGNKTRDPEPVTS